MDLSNRSLLALLVLILVHSVAATADNGDAVVRVLGQRYGIDDEPSLAAECRDEYAAVRIFEYGAGRNAALIRMEKRASGVTAVRRTFGDQQGAEDAVVSEQEFLAVFTELDRSDFWGYDKASEAWRPDDGTLTIEVCWEEKFDFLSIYPDSNQDMDTFVALVAGFWMP